MHCCVVTLHNVTSILLQYMPKPIMMHWRHWTDDMSTIERHPADCNIGSIYIYYRTQVRSWPCLVRQSVIFLRLDWCDPSAWRCPCSRNLSLIILNWIVGIVKDVKWICLSCHMYLSKFFYVFLALCQTKVWPRFLSTLIGFKCSIKFKDSTSRVWTIKNNKPIKLVFHVNFLQGIVFSLPLSKWLAWLATKECITTSQMCPLN